MFYSRSTTTAEMRYHSLEPLETLFPQEIDFYVKVAQNRDEVISQLKKKLKTLRTLLWNAMELSVIILIHIYQFSRGYCMFYINILVITVGSDVL